MKRIPSVRSGTTRSCPVLRFRILGFAGFVLATLLAAGSARAFDSAFVAYSDGGRLVRAEFEGASAPLPLRRNAPLSAGDLLEPRGRLEAVLPDGGLLFLDGRSRATLVSLDDGFGDTSGGTVVDLPVGRLGFALPDGADEVRVDLPEASAYLAPRGRYVVESISGITAVAVIRGEAAVATAAGDFELRAGEAAVFGAGGLRRIPLPRRGFESWIDSRASYRFEGGSSRLPARIRWSSHDLEEAGSWSYVSTLGSWGWSPSLAGYHPYRNGSWTPTHAGLTWWPDESWGWVTSHYGSWAFVGGRWIWIADDVYSPAWVYWYSDASYVGWAPVGYWDAWGSSGSAISFGFHTGWSGGSLRFSSVDPLPWTVLAYDSFRSAPPAVSIAAWSVPVQRVQRESLRSRPGMLIAQPIAVSPSRFRDGAEFARAATLRRGGGPAAREVTPLFTSPAVRRNPPQSLRPLLAEARFQRNIDPLIRLGRLSEKSPTIRAAKAVRPESWRTARSGRGPAVARGPNADTFRPARGSGPAGARRSESPRPAAPIAAAPTPSRFERPVPRPRAVELRPDRSVGARREIRQAPPAARVAPAPRFDRAPKSERRPGAPGFRPAGDGRTEPEARPAPGPAPRKPVAVDRRKVASPRNLDGRAANVGAPEPRSGRPKRQQVAPPQPPPPAPPPRSPEGEERGKGKGRKK